VEERRPVDERDEILEGHVRGKGTPALSTSRHRDLLGRPITGKSVRPGLGDTQQLLRRILVIKLRLQLRVALLVARDEGVALLAEQRGGDRHAAARVEDVHDRTAVVWGDLDGGVRGVGGGAADQQRQVHAGALHLLGDVRHLVEARGDEPAQADDVDLVLSGRGEDLVTGHHDAEVDDLVVVARQDDADDVLANVVHVAFDGGHEDLAGLALAGVGGLLRLHERLEVGDRFLHHARALDHLG
jgi:hypothetical protein